MAEQKFEKASLPDWEALDDEVRAELIDGVIYDMAGPSAVHQEISGFLTAAIRAYLKGKNCRCFAAPFDTYLQHNDEETPHIVQPDLLVICDRDKITEKGCKGSPDWVIEIVSPGTARKDYITKLNLYADYGVKEYWIVNPKSRTVTVYHFERDLVPTTFSFDESIKANLLHDLTIDFSQIDI